MLRNLIKYWLLPPGVLYMLRDWGWDIVCRRHCSTLSKFCRKHDKLFVLATGPSLKIDYPKYKEEIGRSDVAVMNFFADSDIFWEIKPTMYVLEDPVYFSPFKRLEKDGRGNLRTHVEKLCAALTNDVDWPMSVIVPDAVSASAEFLTKILTNKNISLLRRNSRSGLGPISRIDLWLMKHQMIFPLTQTVANSCMGIGIVVGYKEIWLLGADTSMHAIMRVDQRTNEMYLENSHFYGNNREVVKRSSVVENPYTVAAWLKCASNMFASYEQIKMLADYCGVRVVNGCSFSWVDALERPQT